VSSTNTTTTVEIIESTLFDEIARLGPDREAISRGATFEELDIDSLDLVELVQVVEQRWGVVLEAEDFAELSTVGEAIELIASRAE
jgi:acyl carrier protein